MTETVERGNRKVRTGRVMSAEMDKTIVVQVERRIRHKLYGKEVKKYKKFYVHDEENKAVQGDLVRISETRPISKTKNWRLIEVLEHQD